MVTARAAAIIERRRNLAGPCGRASAARWHSRTSEYTGRHGFDGLLLWSHHRAAGGSSATKPPPPSTPTISVPTHCHGLAAAIESLTPPAARSLTTTIHSTPPAPSVARPAAHLLARPQPRQARGAEGGVVLLRRLHISHRPHLALGHLGTLGALPPGSGRGLASAPPRPQAATSAREIRSTSTSPPATSHLHLPPLTCHLRHRRMLRRRRRRHRPRSRWSSGTWFAFYGWCHSTRSGHGSAFVSTILRSSSAR